MEPASCLSGTVLPGKSCVLTCAPGYKIAGSSVAECLQGRMWSTTNLNCIPIPVVRPGMINIYFYILFFIQNYYFFFVKLKWFLLAPQPTGAKTRVNHGEIHSRGHIDHDESLPRQHYSQAIIRPYIKCPRDTTLILPKNKKTIYVRLEQPKSNVNWAR